MADASRARITVESRDLGPAIRAQARARGMTVSAFVRMAVARMLEGAAGVEKQSRGDNPGHVADEPVKITVRLPRRIAREVSVRAQATGLSNGLYLSSLVDGVSLPSAAAYEDAAKALGASTDQLAVAVADLNAFARQIRRGTPASADTFDGTVATLTHVVRTHLVLASRLIADLKPLATWRRDAGAPADPHRVAS